MSVSATMEDLKHLRVDQVGGLAVPSALRRVFEAYKQGKASEEEFGRAKDEAIRHVIAKQESIGFPILTDGELRRRNFQESFSESVSGFDVPAEDKSMEGVSLQPLVRAEQNFTAHEFQLVASELGVGFPFGQCDAPARHVFKADVGH